MVSPLQSLDRPTFNGRGVPPPVPALDTTGLRPRRSLARLLAGLLLAALLAFVFVWWSQRTDLKQPVLAVTRAVAAGQVLTPTDLVAVRVAVEPGVPVVPAAQRGQVVGHTAAVPLVRGALLAPRQVGAPSWPPPGQAEIAVLVKAGHAPAGLQAGASVMVLISPTPTSSGGGGQNASASAVQAAARVVGVDRAADGSGSVTVSLLVGQDDGMRLAGSTGEVSLVLLAPQG